MTKMRKVKPLINISYRQSITFAAFLVLYEFLTYISNDMIMPGMHLVVKNFSASDANMATSVTCFMLGGASLQFFLGPLSDIFGRRKLMLGGVFVFLLSTFLLAVSQNMTQFLVERFFQGMGICFIGAIGYSTLQDIFNDSDAVKLTAIMANLSIIAPLLGPIAGAAFVSHGNWRSIFYLISALTVVAFIGLLKSMPEPIGQTDINGRTIQAEPFCIQKMIQNYATLLASKPYVYTVLMYGLMGIPCMIWIALSPQMIIGQGDGSLIQYGLWQIPMFSSFIIANTLLTRWIDKIGIEKLMKIGIVLVILSMGTAFLSVHFLGQNFKALVPSLILYFFGYAISSSPIYRRMYSVTNVSKGTTGALISLSIMLIQSFGIECSNWVFQGSKYMQLSEMLFFLALGIAVFYQLSIKALRQEDALAQASA